MVVKLVVDGYQSIIMVAHSEKIYVNADTIKSNRKMTLAELNVLNVSHLESNRIRTAGFLHKLIFG